MKLTVIRCAVVAAVALSLIAATVGVVKKVSEYPNVTVPGTNDFFLLAITNAPGTNHNIKYSQLKAAINATNTYGPGTAGRVATWTGSNSLGSVATAPDGYVLGLLSGLPVFLPPGQPSSANLTNWSALATSAKQDAIGYTPQPASANLTNWSALATSAKQDALGYTPQPASANLTNWSAIATNAMVNGTGSPNTLAIWSGTNLLAYVINGVGILTNDGAGGFGFTTNIAQAITINNFSTTNLTVYSTLTVSNIITTNITVLNSLTTSNFFTVNGNHNVLVVSNTFTLLPAGPSKLLRTDSNTNVVAATIGTGLVFDGTTLYPTNLVDAQINSLAATKLTGTIDTNRLSALIADLGNLAATIATGDLLTYSGTHLSRIPASTAGYLLTANGAGVASTYQVAAIPTNFPNGVFTNYVQMPWTTLTMTGSNVSTINLAAGSMFKLTLTNNAFLGAPSGLPGTNLAQTIQIHVAQDGTGVRTLTLTNAGWVLSGSGTSTNAVASISTNANAVSVLTFSTSPFSSTLLYGVLATTP